MKWPCTMIRLRYRRRTVLYPETDPGIFAVWRGTGSGKSKDRSFYGNEETSRRIRYEEAGQRYLFHAFGELLYMKFLQGNPSGGAAGGIYDTVYLQRIMKYVKIKYQKRFLLDKARKRLP